MRVAPIPGANELVGKGVYRGIPNHIPPAVRDGHAVVVGDPVACAVAARTLMEAGWRVTAVTNERPCCAGIPRDCRLRTRAELVCSSGMAYREAILVRRIRTGRLEAFNAAALFILSAPATKCPIRRA